MAVFEALLAKLALGAVFGKAKNLAGKGVAALNRVPTPVWEAVTVVAYLAAFVGLHQHYANAALKAADTAGYQRRANEDAKALIELRQRAATAEATGKAIAQDTRSTNDATNRSIASDTSALLVRGPGASRSRCVGNPTVPAASGEPVTPAHPADDAGNLLPGGDGTAERADVPWRWLVGRAGQCDLDRAENVAWRDWYARQSAAWLTLKAETERAK
jgi:hypothetical protein